MLTTNYYNDFFEFGQQKINFSFFELSLPDDDPVYTLKKVMEDLDFSGLLANCSDKGRTGYNPIMMYAVVTYANMRGIRSVDRIVELCERDLAFIWLTHGQKPKRDAFYEFKGKKLTSERMLRDHGKRPEQLFQDRPGSYFYADERGSYAERTVKAGVQRTDCCGKLFHHSRLRK